MSTPEQQMIDYLTRLIARPGVVLREDTPLVSAGLIDSMALVDVLLELENVTHLRIPAGKVQPKDMDTVILMVETARRVGKPRK
jgi:acyl carrier protein